MSFEVPLDDVDTSSVGGFEKMEPGFYHTQIVNLNEDGGDKGEMLVWFEILRGTAPNQDGKNHREKFRKDAKAFAIRKLLALAIASGLTTRDQLDEMKARGERPVIDWQQCIGKQVCIHIERTASNDGKEYTQIAWDEIWHPLDKRASSIPLHPGMLKAAGITLPENRHVDGVLAKPATGNTQQQRQTKTTGTESASNQQPQKSAVDDVLAGVA